MTAGEIAAGLGGRRVGPGRWKAICPAHNDHDPSLSIRQGSDKPLVHCWAGCEQEAVIDALRVRGLWPERPMPERAPMTPEQRRVWAVRRRRAERMAGDAEAWRAALVDELETSKRGAYEAGLLEDVFTIAPQLEHVHGLRGAALAEAFLKVRAEQPEQTEMLIAGRRRDEQVARNLCALLVRKLGETTDASIRKTAA